MQFDATTFILEIVNFLALLWLLTRFLYRPVQDALDARTQARVREDSEFTTRHNDLDRQAQQLAAARSVLQAQRESAERELAQEIAAKRHQDLAALAREIEAEATKARARLVQEQASAAAREHDVLLRQAASFVARYLTRLASPALEAAIIELFLADLLSQASQAQLALREHGASGAPTIDITTAFEVAPQLRQRVEGALATMTGGAAFCWRSDPALLAGLRVQITGYRLEASLQRGVDAFVAEGDP
jgi:F-type H+-transporting ATPase subunit b